MALLGLGLYESLAMLVIGIVMIIIAKLVPIDRIVYIALYVGGAILFVVGLILLVAGFFL